MTFALLGTAASFIVVGGIMYGVASALGLNFELTQCLYFGALISATDPGKKNFENYFGLLYLSTDPDKKNSEKFLIFSNFFGIVIVSADSGFKKNKDIFLSSQIYLNFSDGFGDFYGC